MGGVGKGIDGPHRHPGALARSKARREQPPPCVVPEMGLSSIYR